MRTTPSMIRLLAPSAMLVAMTACGPAPNNAAPPASNAAPKDPPEVDPITIMLHGEKDGSCRATVDPEKRQAKRRQWLKWIVRETGCNDFSFSKVKIVYDDNVVKTKESHVVDGTVYIVAKISRSTDDADDAKPVHTYSVYFGDSKAADPEVDVIGDCNGCQLDE